MPNVQRLDAVCDISMGQAPDGETYNNEGIGWPLIAGAGDFGEMYPVAKKFTTEASRLSEVGDIVLGIRASIGEKVISDDVYCLGRGVAGLRAKKNLDSRYLWHWLTHIEPVLMRKAKGATFKQVNKEDIGELGISLPPLPEQRSIAAILDQADALRAKRREALAELDKLAQSIFVEMFGDPASNAKGWSICKLEDVSKKITDGTHRTPVYQQSGIEFLSAKDLKDGGIAWGTGKFISEEEHVELVRRCNPERGDILLAKSGSLGNVAIIDRSHQFSLFESLCLIKHDRECIEGLYIIGLLRNPTMLSYLLGKNKGMAIKHLHLVDVRSLNIPLPPIQLQREYSQRITTLDGLRIKMLSSLAEQEALFSSIQHRAFWGEL